MALSSYFLGYFSWVLFLGTFALRSICRTDFLGISWVLFLGIFCGFPDTFLNINKWKCQSCSFELSDAFCYLRCVIACGRPGGDDSVHSTKWLSANVPLISSALFNMITYTFILKDPNGQTSPVFLAIRDNGRRLKISTGLTVQTDAWDKDNFQMT